MSIRDVPREHLEIDKTRLRPSFDGVFGDTQVGAAPEGIFAGFGDRVGEVLVILPGRDDPVAYSVDYVEVAP